MGLSSVVNEDFLSRNHIPYSRKEYQKDTYLIYKGQEIENVYIIVDGEFKVFVSDINGREVTLNILNQGETIGELAAITHDTGSADVVATKTSAVIAIKKPDFIAMLKKHPDVTWVLLDYLALRTKNLSNKVAGLVLNDVFGRITNLLTQRADDDGVVNGLTHQDIASEVGSSREMTSKILASLKKAEYLDIQRKKITILKDLPVEHDEL